MADTTNPDPRKAGVWVIVWGVLLIVAGMLAIIAPAPAALAAELVLAWLLVFCGAVQGIYAWQQRVESGFGWKLFGALATFALGAVMLVFPIAGIATLALVIGAFLFASGVSSLMLAFKRKPEAGWGWILFDGALSIAIAILIAIGWPQSSIAFVGILVGVYLISGGLWRIVLGRALRAGKAPVPV